MAEIANHRVVTGGTSVERQLEAEAKQDLRPLAPKNELDGEAARKLHRRALDWWFEERERQSINRYQMAIDSDFYDNIQWAQDDAAEVSDRGQAPIVYNEVAPMIDWLIGTERRTRVDWQVAPRTEDDVEGADAKTKVLKYLSDVNRSQFVRSRAFADAVKAGVGWIESGVRADPTKELIYNRHEDWRFVLWDSCAMEPDLSDGRYQFRWRWTDLDIATAIFPKRKTQLERTSASTLLSGEEEEDFWYMGQHYQGRDASGQIMDRRVYMADAGVVGKRRQRVKLIECWYREPVVTSMLYGDPRLDGRVYDKDDPSLRVAVESGHVGVVDQMMMRMHVAVFTETDMLAMMTSPYRHNGFPLTPIWCYRRGRDRMPYGAIRRVRDIQEDLNKRASKAQFLYSTNQIIADEGAVEDWEEAREEVDRPDGVIVTRSGKRFEIRRDAEMAKGHMEFMSMDAAKIQRNAGVNDENLGRETNASSGEAIKARQIQGSVTTTEPFDNLRLATQIDGEKQLSLAEQFMTMPRVVRLVGERGKWDWTKINEPVQNPDGTIQFLNDITASMADFVVQEQDFHGTLRQAMFDAMMAMASRAGIAPEISLRLLRMAFEFSDFPNKDEIVGDIRRMTGEPDPAKKLTPEEEQAAAMQQQLQMEAMERNRKLADLEVEKVAAEVREINAKAASLAAGSPDAAIEGQIREIQAKAADAMDAAAQEVAKMRAESLNRTMQINREADTAVEVARIEADAAIRAAEIEQQSADTFAKLQKQMDTLAKQVAEAIEAGQQDSKAATEAITKVVEKAVEKATSEVAATAEKATKAADKEAKAATPAPAAPPQATVVFEAGAIQIDAKSPPTTKTVTGTDSAGNRIELTVKPADDGKGDGKPKKDK